MGRGFRFWIYAAAGLNHIHARQFRRVGGHAGDGIPIQLIMGRDWDEFRVALGLPKDAFALFRRDGHDGVQAVERCIQVSRRFGRNQHTVTALVFR